MAETREFLVPEYYERFTCKGSACRSNCCHGWTITISMQDYFKLLSVPCSPELRRKLDSALHLMRDADPQRYAQILPDWRGNCPLQREDGLCALQLECGEEMLSSTCRYYPRGVRTAFGCECCLSASCEGVLETMFASREPLRAVHRTLTFDMTLPEQDEQGKRADDDRRIQAAWIDLLQDRTMRLPIRLQQLGCVAHALHRSPDEMPEEAIKAALCGFAPEAAEDALSVLGAQHELLSVMAACSLGFAPYAEDALSALGLTLDTPQPGELEAAYGKYRAACWQLERLLPDYWIDMEHMLVNAVLYQGYPYSPEHESVWEEYCALIARYAALRLLTAGYMVKRSQESDFVDVCAAAFKPFDHARFDHNALVVFHRLDMLDEKAMRRMALA